VEIDMPFVYAAIILFCAIGLMCFGFVYWGTREPEPKPKSKGRI